MNFANHLYSKMNYKSTLNLPQTTFPMKANLTILEPRIIQLWQKLDIYQKLRSERKNADKFILHDGPPYANGLIHIGHALNKILKDIVLKYKLLSGYDCPFIVGWDCHGLPVEHQLFKELKLTKHDVQVDIFRKKAKNYALKFVELQKEGFIQLGIFSDWENPYLTTNKEYEYSVIKLLEDLTSKGYIYRGRKPVNWCAECETALAEAEVEYSNKESDSIYFTFKTIGAQEILPVESQVLVWTTTPWTIISNVAVAVNPTLEYCLFSFQNKNIIAGQHMLSALEKMLKTQVKIIKTFTGTKLEGLKIKHPFLNKEVAIILADFVSSNEGSGCVHIAPGHGAEDFSLVKTYNLPIIMPVDHRGIFTEPEDFKGKDIKTASISVIEKLKKNESLISHQKITHSYPHCWRCKKPIVFRATFQWFLDVSCNNLRNRLIKLSEKTKWTPDSGKERMKAMILTRPDWCLSRQRLWGIPIPAIKCKTCNQTILSPEIIAKTASIFLEKGSDSWFNLPVSEFIPEKFKCSKCNSSDFAKEYDILDVWFESGASFSGVLKKNSDLAFPADLYLEGSDQHRGWFQVSLILSAAKENAAPFKQILTHGFVVDGEGKKMSKSMGNVISPQEISQKYGAEILRLWVAYSNYSEDVRISPEIIKQLVDTYRKIRNTIRFILGNISDFKPSESKIGMSQLTETDLFIISKASLLFDEITSCYNNFSFYKVCQKIFNFCNIELSSFYLDISKDRLYTFSQNSPERRSAQNVLYCILEMLLKIIAPILPFTAEEAYSCWDQLPNKKESIFISKFNEIDKKNWRNKPLEEKWEKIILLRTKILKELETSRNKGNIGSSLEGFVYLTLPKNDFEFYASYQEILKEILVVSGIEIKNGDFNITIRKTKDKKCTRCWMYNRSVGKNEKHPDICNKCVQALKEEKRET